MFIRSLGNEGSWTSITLEGYYCRINPEKKSIQRNASSYFSKIHVATEIPGYGQPLAQI